MAKRAKIGTSEHFAVSCLTLLVFVCLGLVSSCANDAGSSAEDMSVEPDGNVLCGNGVIDGNELCDNEAVGSATCVSEGFPLGGALMCNSDCDGYDTSMCNVPATCGNDTIESGEICDGQNVAGESCQSRGFGSGELACNPSCSGFDTAGCVPLANCNNGVVEGDEVCDQSDMAGETCESLGFVGGELQCTGACDAFDTSECSNCGNSNIDEGEDCEGTNLNGADCQTLGFDLGNLSCGTDCRYDASECTFEGCGDGVKNGNEDCDGMDLGGESCEGLGYDSGNLRCTGNCRYDTGPCVACGDDVAASPEVCDGSDLRGETCATVDSSFDGGTLTCAADCSTFVTDECTTCGDGVAEGMESCDLADLDGQSCSSIGQGFTAGIIACAGDCSFDVSGCTTCGDGSIETGEFCEPTDLLGESCISLYFDSGALLCNSQCTDFDTSGCNKAAVPGAGDLVISEIMLDPDAVADSAGEYFELHNPGSIARSINGCRIESSDSMGNTASWTIVGAPPIAAGGYISLATESMGGPGFSPDVTYTMINLENVPDDLSIVCDSSGQPVTIDAVSWDAGPLFPNPTGASLTLAPNKLSAVDNDDGFSWCISTSIYNTAGGRTDRGTPGAPNDDCAIIYFSEYVEGNSFNKAVEVYNGGSAPFDLSQCVVNRYSNGTTMATGVALNGTLVGGDVYVFCNPNLVGANCDQTNSTLNVNGDDAIELVCASQRVDVIGRIGEQPASGGWEGTQDECSPGDTPCSTSADCGGNTCAPDTVSTANRTLRRKCSVTSGDRDGTDPFDPTVEWEGWPLDALGDLGQYNCP